MENYKASTMRKAFGQSFQMPWHVVQDNARGENEQFVERHMDKRNRYGATRRSMEGPSVGVPLAIPDAWTVSDMHSWKHMDERALIRLDCPVLNLFWKASNGPPELFLGEYMDLRMVEQRAHLGTSQLPAEGIAQSVRALIDSFGRSHAMVGHKWFALEFHMKPKV